uniref:Putative cyclin-D6-1 n=1 Tax=Anthurium amnicola TaxID=1678845 RepID=A0A1D1YYH1_9ARAE
MEFDLEDPLAGAWEDDELATVEPYRSDSATALFAAEADHLCSPVKIAADAPLRRDAVSLLLLLAQGSCCLDPFVVYLATNYVDRFLSREAIPRDKPWIVRLLAIACLSLACKMKKADFSVADSQAAEEGIIYDGHTIRRMELLVLRALHWRMRSITPFSFLRFFLALFRPADPPLLAALKARASEIVFWAQNEMKLLDYKPSVVAASALLTASHELFPVQFPSFRSAISSCPYVNKEEVWDCCVAMEELAAAMGGCDATAAAASSCCDTPVTVLRRQHRHCSSSESESTAAATAAGCPPDHDAKKRRVGRVSGEYCAVFHRPTAAADK